jgi:hypothetical protein
LVVTRFIAAGSYIETGGDMSGAPPRWRSDWWWRSLGAVAVTAITVVSLALNAQFACNQFAAPVDKWVYVLASLAFDLLKTVLPLAGRALWRARSHLFAAAAGLIWIGCVTWSLAAAVGFTAETRAHALAQRTGQAEILSGWRTRVYRAEAQLAALGPARPSSVVRGELQHPSVAPEIWARTAGCTEITRPDSTAACATIVRLRAELARAEAFEKLDADIETGRAHLSAGAAELIPPDAQASLLAGLTGLAPDTIRAGLAVLVALLIEAVSACGFAILTAAAAPASRRQAGEPMPQPNIQRRRDKFPKVPAPKGSAEELAAPAKVRPEDGTKVQPNEASTVRANGRTKVEAKLQTEKRATVQQRDPANPAVASHRDAVAAVRTIADFLRQGTRRCEGSGTEATVLYHAFLDFCTAQSLPKLSQRRFGEQLGRLGLPKDRTSHGRVRYRGIVLGPA